MTSQVTTMQTSLRINVLLRKKEKNGREWEGRKPEEEGRTMETW